MGIYAEESKSINIPIWKNKENTYRFQKNEFKVSLNFDTWKLNPVILNNSREIKFQLNNNAEVLEITEINENQYVFCFSALGYEQIFIYNIGKDVITEPFFDLKNTVAIRGKDLNHLVLFGDTWNSDKDIMPNQTVELYLFSTAKQKHYKIAEKKGAAFRVKILNGYEIEYTDQYDNWIKYDYSEWIAPSVLYTASGFLVERKTVYGPENLTSEKGLPWASANGFGINDKISISGENFSRITFINGYISEEKPYLYEQNSRVKKVLITNSITGKSMILDIKDERNKQEFDISSICTSGNQTIDIVIKEIYSGIKYKDLCIQAILIE